MVHASFTPDNTVDQNTPGNQSEKRANEILNALIEQTAQAEYDDISIDRLIMEYQALMH